MSTKTEHSDAGQAEDRSDKAEGRAEKRRAQVEAARQKAEFILSRAWGLFRAPNEEWEQIRAENTNVGSILLGYVAPLAAIMPVCELIGTMLFDRALHVDLGAAIVRAAISFLLTVAVVFLLGLMINAASESFDADRDDLSAQKVAAYSLTPFLLSGLFFLWPPLWWLSIFAIGYSVFLIYRGLVLLMKAPEDRAIGYTSTVAVSGMVAFLVLFGIAVTVTT